MSSATPDDPPQGLTPRVLNFIRWFLLGSVLFIGGVCWFMTTREVSSKPLPETTRTWLTYGLAGLLVLSVAGVLLMRRQKARQETFLAKGRRCIIGWAIAEGSAFFGAVYLILTGHPVFYGAGLGLVTAACFVLLPVPRSD